MSIYEKAFALAKEKGIKALEIKVSKATSLSISLYHGEVEGFKNESSSNVSIRGIYQGHFGQVSCNSLNAANLGTILDDVIENAKVIEKAEPPVIFEGSKKYHKVSTYNKDLPNIPVEVKKENLFKFEKALYAADKRITDVAAVEFGEDDSEYTILNSYGLKLKTKNNNFYCYAEVVAKEGDDVKTGGDAIVDNDYSAFDPEKMAKKIVEETVAKLGGETVETKKMKAVLSPDVTGMLLNFYVSSAEAENVQKHSSLFEGKLNTKVASSRLTVSEKPLAKTVYARWFDDEGVATYNKDIIKNGVLATYLYNLETAAKDGVETTGNGYGGGGKIGIGTSAIFVRPGKKSQEELFQEVGEGIYITDLEGANAGINPTSGNFSLKAVGFLIKDGKKAEPVSLITASGSLPNVFRDVVMVGSDVKPLIGGTFAPSIYIKSLNIAGK